MTESTIKKTVGLILALLVLISALPMTAFAAGDMVSYDLWLGSTQVTSENKDDILGDGGKAKFDPDSNKLTLDDPVVTGYHTYNTYKCKLFTGVDLEITGSCDLSGYTADCGVYSFADNYLKISGGAFTVTENECYGIWAFGDVYISCDLTVESEKNYAVYCDDIYLSEGFKSFEATSTMTQALYYMNRADWTSGAVITYPEGGRPRNHTVYTADGSTAAGHVAVNNTEYGKYKLWVGATQVSEDNKDDILGDGGKAKFDPESGTLTLDDPDIAAVAITFEGYSCKIYSEGVDLTVAGSYTCSDAADYCIAVFDAGLTLRGGELNAAAGDGFAIYADSYIDIASGEVSAVNSSSSCGTIYSPGYIRVGGDVISLDILNSFGMSAVSADSSLELDDGLIITVPYGGYAGENTIYDSENNIPSYVRIAPDDSDPVAIDHIEISDVTPPAAGKRPEYTASLPDDAEYRLQPDDLSYRLNGVAWLADGRYIDAGSAVFEAGKEYTVQVSVVPNRSRDAFSPDFTCTLNGMTAESIAYADDNSLATVSYTFTCGGDSDKIDLWLGSTQVTSKNKDDILNDGGKAKFDPATGTLTLNDPVIRGSSDDSSGYSCVILSKGIDLTVEGSYHMEPTEIYSGLRVEDGDLTLAGDFTIYAMYFSGVYASGDVTVASGTLTAVTEEGYNGIYSNKVLYIGEDVTQITASGLGDSAIWGEDGIVMSDKLYVSSPEGAYVDGSAVMTSDGETWASRAVIGPKPEPVEDRLLGDADNNGVVNVFDSSYIQKGLTGANGYPDYSTMDKSVIGYRAADSDGNGIVNIFDAALVQKYLSGASNAQGYGIDKPLQ